MMRKLIYSVVILAVVLSLGVVAPLGFVKAQSVPAYQLIIQDDDDSDVDSHDLKEIWAAVDETSLYIKGVTYGNWVDPEGTWFSIFLDVDRNAETGGTDAHHTPPNFPKGVHGIGADYMAVVGGMFTIVPWGSTWWRWSQQFNYASYCMGNNTNTFEIKISLDSIGNPEAIDIVLFADDFSANMDYAPDEGYATYPSPVIEITIDIKPGSEPNSINLGSKGVVPVAILTKDDPEFDATTVDPETVKFADAVPKRWTSEDMDEDGDIDLLFHFKTQELNLTESSEDATLTGETFDDDKITGTDSVRIVPAKGQK